MSQATIEFVTSYKSKEYDIEISSFNNLKSEPYIMGSGFIVRVGTSKRECLDDDHVYRELKEIGIPTVIRKALAGENIPIYGDGKNIRDWLYVLDHCKGIDLVYKKGESGETYNIGGNNERDNMYIVNTICDILDNLAPKEESYKKLISFVSDRPGHDFRYAIDASKIENELGWKANENFESGIKKTINWYLDKYKK